MKLDENIRRIRTWEMMLSGVISLVLSFTIYLLFIQSPLVSKRELLATILIFVALLWPVYLLLDRLLIPKFRRFSYRGKFILILLSAIIGLLIVLITNHPPLYLISPSHIFRIEIPAVGKEIYPNREVTISWITTDLGDVSFVQLQKSGEWVVTETGISHFGPDAASLEWQGKTGRKISIDLIRTTYDNPAVVTWDQKSVSFNLSDTPGDMLTISQAFNTKEGDHILISISLWAVASFLFFLVTILLITREIQNKPVTKRKRLSWLLYSFPMIAVWSIYLLTFWPGMMSPDSNNQWGQVITGRLNDLHPVFHTLLIWLLTRIWLSPTIVLVFQIVALSVTSAWGIDILDGENLPSWASWGLTAIFSFSPLIGNMVVILWKDIPYSICLFLLSLIFLKIILTKGAWLEKKFSWVFLGLIYLCVSSFRHNGIAVAIISFPIILISYRNKWKPILFAAGLTALMYIIIQGPLYSLLNVDRELGKKQQTLIQHIAAHIVKGGKLPPDELHLAESILPINRWKYNCCDNYKLLSSPEFSKNRLTDNVQNIQNLFVRLAFKEPLVEIEHLTCISSLVWGMPSQCGSTTLLPYTATLWIDPGGGFFHENSLFPFLRNLLSGVLIDVRTNPNLTIFIAPAVYLFLSLYNTVLLAFRRRCLRVLLFIIPAVIQSLTLALVNVSSEFRYQFGVYLIGLFSFGLLVLALFSPKIKKEEKLHML
jgi:hypothetical protein